MTDIRQTSLNLNQWYAVAKTSEVQNRPLGVTIWKKNIMIYRNQISQEIYALEDRCPHRQVKLSSGQIKQDQIECIYHGWQFNHQGKCSYVPYLTDKQKLPTCQITRYPIKEQDGFIWVFPGDGTKSDQTPILGIMEWDHLNYIGTLSIIDTKAHFSYLIENLMDMYHGNLHRDWQAWADPILINLTETPSQVEAYYQAQSYYKIDKIWSISQLFFPGLRKLHPAPLNVSYIYPHWKSTLGEYFTIYCLITPINETHTKAYLIHFTSLNAFWRLHKLPIWFRRFIKNSLFGAAQKLLDGLVRQDIEFIEQEQQAYLDNPQNQNYELNPTLGAVQRLIKNQLTFT